MFHQANLRVNDVPTTTVGGKKGKYSLLMTWTEVITAEIMRLFVLPYLPKMPYLTVFQYHLAF